MMVASHKDDVLAQSLLAIIKDELPGNCVITSGVHVDHITNAQIHASFFHGRKFGTANVSLDAEPPFRQRKTSLLYQWEKNHPN